MARGKSLYYIVVLLGSPLFFLLILECMFRIAGVNDDYRLHNPSSLIRENSVFLHRVRSNLDFEVPRFENLDSAAVGEGPLKEMGRYRVVTNSLGFREDHEISPEPAESEVRIICLGDSVTFGWGSDNEQSYPQLLHKELSVTSGPHITVINSGQPGFTSYQCLLFFRFFLCQYKPDLLIVACGHNDHHLGIRGYNSAREKVDRNTHGVGKVKMEFHKLDTYLLLERFFAKLSGKISFWLGKDIFHDMVQPGSVQEYRSHLEHLVREVEAAGGQCLLLTEPRVAHEPVSDSYNRALVELTHVQDIHLLDLIPLFDSETERLVAAGEKTSPPSKLFWDDVHPTPYGNGLIARTVAEYLRGPGSSLLEPVNSELL